MSPFAQPAPSSPEASPISTPDVLAPDDSGHGNAAPASPTERSSEPLRVLRIASPCSASWDDMAGDERARFCRDCRLHVYDVANLTAAEALELIRRHEGQRLCLRLHRRADGTVITRDCPVGWRELKRKTLQAAAAVAALTVALGAGTLTALGVAILGPFGRPAAPTSKQSDDRPFSFFGFRNMRQIAIPLTNPFGQPGPNCVLGAMEVPRMPVNGDAELLDDLEALDAGDRAAPPDPPMLLGEEESAVSNSPPARD